MWGPGDPHVRLLCCPVCGGGFGAPGGPDAPGAPEVAVRTLTCGQGHAFDVARAGYVNLGPGGSRTTGTGDTPEMLAARRRFLDRNRFAPLSGIVNRLVAQALPPPGAAGDVATCVVEVGTGTGHHLATLRSSLTSARGPKALPSCWFGIDVSKAACRLASRTHPTARFVVADVKRGLPLRSGCAAAVLDVFAPRDPEEFRRILHPEGLVLVVIPAPDHLHELVRDFGLLHVHPGKEDALLAGFARRGLHLAHREKLRFTMDLGPEDAADLVAMGPSAHHRPPPATDRPASSGQHATASFVVLLLQPRRPGSVAAQEEQAAQAEAAPTVPKV
jgi:23S rRNA (guanine745-N1)-methyltransferase